MGLMRLLSGLLGHWPADLPRLYPNVDDLKLAQFLSEDEFARIKSFDNVYILPFWSIEADRAQNCFGVGLSRLMIRNLMLLRNISIHGPEDTPMVPFEVPEEALSERNRACYVKGIAEFGATGYSVHFEMIRPGREKISETVRQRDFREFIRACTATIGRNLVSGLETTVPDAWDVGQPRDARSLQRCGELAFCFEHDELAAKAGQARKALAEDPGFAVLTWDIDETVPGARNDYLTALKHDPYNAQLYFLLFIAVWKSRGHQPEAMQFCRKAIELSPGHGKAHMCAPHSAHPEAKMLKHSALGYKLLPGNPFAVNNYVINLRRHGAPAKELIELAKDGIETDPCDPGNYLQAIDLYCEVKEYDKALEMAEQLQELFEPEMNERALYCLKQNPERTRLIESGQYDPAAENRKVIAQLRERVQEGGK